MTIQEDLRRKLSGHASGSNPSTSTLPSSNSSTVASGSTAAATTSNNAATAFSSQQQQYAAALPHFAHSFSPSGAPLTATLSLPITPSPSSTTMPTALTDPERTYVFPATTGVARPSGRLGDIMSTHRGHARSVSHGGNASLSCSVPTSAGSVTSAGSTGPSSNAIGGMTTLSSGKVLRSAMKGHQRAFSQGQISIKDTMAASAAAHAAASAANGGGGGPIIKRPGHNRVGSKTDFILPPGHKDSPTAAQIVPRGELSSSASTGGGSGGSGVGARTGSGHSRQASRSESIYTLRRAELPPWWRRWWCCHGLLGGAQFQDDRDRHRMVVPNHTVPAKTPKRDHPNGKRVGNKIRTTKYTLLSFVPNNLLEQFHRLANLYFIFIVVLNWFVGSFAKEVTTIPVAFVLGVTAVKDLFEDRRRRSSDKRINNSTCRVYNG